MNRNIMRGVKSRSHKCFMNFHLSFSYIALNNLYMMWKASLLNHDFVWGCLVGEGMKVLHPSEKSNTLTTH